MLNLSQRLILGCVLIAALGVSLVVTIHRALAQAGELRLAVALVTSLILVEVATVMLVLHPIRMLANDAKKLLTVISSIGWNGAAATALA